MHFSTKYISIQRLCFCLYPLGMDFLSFIRIFVAKPKKAAPIQSRGANFNDVLIKLIDSVYNLVNSGNIVGVILLYFCVQVFFITNKLTEDALDKYIGKIFAFDYFYIFPLGVALGVSLIANFYQAKVYRRHIETLVETRKELIHGLQAGELKQLKKHASSGIDSLEHTDDC